MTLRELLKQATGLNWSPEYNVGFGGVEERINYLVTGRQLKPEDATHFYEHVNEVWWNDKSRRIYIDFEDSEFIKDLANDRLAGNDD